MDALWLRGREHLELAAVELRSEAACAVALSRGGAAKVYAYTDPNEDVVLALVDARRVFLAVADGHGGFEGAELAIETVHAWALALPARIGSDQEWHALALRAFATANARIREAATQGGRRLSRTTLALALAERDAGVLRWAAIGDSHVFHAANGVLDLAHAHGHDHPSDGEAYFLGYGDETEASLATKCRIGDERVPGSQAVALVTDGLSARGVGVDEPEDVVAEVIHAAAALPPDERAAAMARNIVDAALAAHRRRKSGDNVAVATAWLAGG